MTDDKTPTMNGTDDLGGPLTPSGRLAGKWVRFVIYGLMGWCFEIVWSSIMMKYDGVADDWKLKGHTFLWVLPVYGLAAWLFEPAHHRMRRWFFLIRAAVYSVGFMAVEYLAGAAITLMIGQCPWDYNTYTSGSIQGFVQPKLAPFWAVVGLALEPVHDFLERLTPAILRELRYRKKNQPK